MGEITASRLTVEPTASNELGTGYGVFIKQNTVARTDTTAKNLFSLPANAIVLRVTVSGTVNSNAASTATVSVGKTGTATQFVNALSVATNGDKAQTVSISNPGTVGTSPITVIGTYAETGTASTTGGPWTVSMEYIIPLSNP